MTTSSGGPVHQQPDNPPPDANAHHNNLPTQPTGGDELRRAWASITDPNTASGADGTERAVRLASCLAGYAADAGCSIDWLQAPIAAATEPATVRAWLAAGAALPAADLHQLLLAAAWDGLPTSDNALDTLRGCAVHLRAVADTWLEVDDQRTTLLAALTGHADRLALLEPVTPTATTGAESR
jgi:hypothetical protein